jgi:hypothetical protein
MPPECSSSLMRQMDKERISRVVILMVAKVIRRVIEIQVTFGFRFPYGEDGLQELGTITR